ncbi:Murein DD-endopeptidase MepM and murein hydrolase activator NlpD, contain LysM domain [Streptomyces sp. DvalAA-14]|uniref:M23 family metallopeptidase n=1 Tax=unclassified Streptomyces TaxID=2593676 RepID=UPI00081BAE9C|nr:MULTISPECIES: M23 family metallopeptidase [unclassified Streptomyces]MYS24925.1 peptidoglycan DD-metalloendopeptidase family protein [Streptomyces sp. SID4948]SCE50605.1 Murein DD-endopeptidase MepM and murein hydrolase activator NlpD, contain LysM domain [Streptomyces sp. DvalAA-14]
MRLNSTSKNRTPKSVTRGRVAVVTGGLVAAIALGSTAAMAADGGHHSEAAFAAQPATSVSATVQQQVADQKAAAGKAEAVAAKAKAARLAAAQHAEQARRAAAEAKQAAAKAKEQAAAKAAADLRARIASWETPTAHYVLGAGYDQAGPHWAHKHSGQDFVVGTGTTVRAAHTGTVVEAGWGGAYGNNIVIKHDDHTYSQYGHLSHLGVSVGERVITGQTIGLSGSTGNSTGPHLHFEVRTTPYYGSSVEPLHFLRAHGVNP